MKARISSGLSQLYQYEMTGRVGVSIGGNARNPAASSQARPVALTVQHSAAPP
jgi:hypothetical protein